MKTSLFLAVLVICVALATSNSISPFEPSCPVSCRLRGVYNLPHIQSCTKFYRCTHGFFAEFDCPGLTEVFNYQTMQCDDAYEAQCLLHARVD